MSTIRDRITELRRVRAGDLHASPKNWRTHPESQVAALRGTLSEIGYADAVLCRVLPDGGLEVIDGHARKELDPDQIIPCLITDLSEAEAAKLLLTLDPLAAMAEADTKALGRLIEEIDIDSGALQKMIDDLASANGIIAQDCADLPDIEETVRHTCVMPYTDEEVPILCAFLGVGELPKLLGKTINERIKAVVAIGENPQCGGKKTPRRKTPAR